jgi:hypothetical protein
MNGIEVITYLIFAIAVIVVAVQYGISKGWERHQQRIEQQRGVEIKALLEYISIAWFRGNEPLRREQK